MKFLINTVLLCGSFLMFTTSSTLQASAIDDLDEVIFFSDEAKANAINARNAARDLAVLYFQLNDDNIDGYISIIQNEMQDLEESADEIIYYIYQAANDNPAIDPSNIATWGGQLEALEDQVNSEALNLQALIAAGQRSAARTSYRLLRSYLKQQINLAKAIRLEAIALKEIARTYDVRIELLYNGQVDNGSTTLGGYYAFNQDLNEYFYPDYNSDNQFFDLPVGTYTFGSYDGYFDGTNSVVVTLDPSLEGGDGVIVVQLNYWSE